MTSSGNVKLVRSIFADWERGDFSSTRWAHPEIEWVRPDGPVTGTSIGISGLAPETREAISPWEDARVKAQSFCELDSERVLVLVQHGGRGKASGLDLADIRSEGAWLVHVRDGKVTRLVRYWNRDRAFTDLGLAPEAGFPAS